MRSRCRCAPSRSGKIRPAPCAGPEIPVSALEPCVLNLGRRSHVERSRIGGGSGGGGRSPPRRRRHRRPGRPQRRAGRPQEARRGGPPPPPLSKGGGPEAPPPRAGV